MQQGLHANDRLEVQQVVNGVESPRSPAKPVPDVVPKVSPAPQEGDKQVAGTAQKGVETVEVTVTDKAGAAKETAKGKIDGEGKFEVSLQAALAAGDQVSARVPGGSASPAIRVKAKEEKQLQITSIVAHQGDTKVTVLFEPIPESVESTTIQVETGVETKKVTLTADQRKGNKVEVALGRALVPPIDPQSGQKLLCAGTPPPTEYPTSGMVQVTLSGEGKGLRVKPSCKAAVIEPPSLSLNIPIKEGDATIQGEVEGESAGVSKVQITVYQGVAPRPRDQILLAIRAKEDELANSTDEARNARLREQILVMRLSIMIPDCHAEAGVADGKFTAKLTRPLAAGEWVTVRPVFTNNQKGGEASPERVRSVLLDWGRFRAVFSTGAAISLGSDHSSNVDPYIGFTADSRIWGKVLDKEALSTHDAQFPGIIFRDNRWWSLHTFVDTRLTQATKAEAPGTNGTTTTSPPGDNADEPVKATPVSASLFQFGTYLPISFKGTDWVYEGSQYSFFFGPLFKAGWQTLDNGVPVEFVTTVKGAGEEQTTDKKIIDERKGLLPFWGGGLRFGFQKFDLMGSDYRNRQVSTDLIGYLDLTIGKHAAYRTYFPGAPVMENDVTKTTTTSRLDNRIALEARLKIPFTPAFIGVDANMNTDGRDREPNDVRFLVGFRIDANKALGKVFGPAK